MLPKDLGFSQFDEFLPGQAESILAIAASRKRFSVLKAPTGSGKSLSFTAASRVDEAGKPLDPESFKRVCILVGTKALQDQIFGSFEENGAVNIKGKANYECLAFLPGGDHEHKSREGQGCDKGPCNDDKDCSLKSQGCVYYDLIDDALRSQIVVMNYAKWMSMGRNYARQIGRFDMLVCDEADSCMDWVCDFIGHSFNLSRMRKVLGSTLPESELQMLEVKNLNEYTKETGFVDFHSWCLDVAAYIESCIDQTGNRDVIKSIKSWSKSLLDAAKKYHADPGNWVVVSDSDKQKVKLQAVWCSSWASSILFRDVPQVVLSSATFQDEDLGFLGIQRHQAEDIPVKNNFDYLRRPIVSAGQVRINFRSSEEDVKRWIESIDRVIDSRRDSKGIIPSISYRRANTIIGQSRHRDLMLKIVGKRPETLVSEFKRSKRGILVSPSVDVGFDFPGDQCRWILIPKIPFLDRRDPVTDKRCRDKNYPVSEIKKRMIQIFGRGFRYEDDWCEVFILDGNWQWFSQKVLFDRKMFRFFRKGEYSRDWFINSLRQAV